MVSLVCFGVGLTLTEVEKERTSAITEAASHEWILVNDYFSWEKELLNFEKNGSKGEVVNAVFLFMRWYSVDQNEAKKMLRAEIQAREGKYCQAKASLIAQGNLTVNTKYWLEYLDLITAGTFIWCVTTPRYNLNVEDAYQSLHAKEREEKMPQFANFLTKPTIRPNSIEQNPSGSTKLKFDSNSSSTGRSEGMHITPPKTPNSSTTSADKAGAGQSNTSISLSSPSLNRFKDVSL